MERRLIRVGEPIRGEVSGGEVEATLSVMLATRLLDPSAPLPKVISIYRWSGRVGPGPFEIGYPDTLPPTVYTRGSQVKWTLTFRAAGGLRGLFSPKGRVRIKVLPRPPRQERSGWIRLEGGPWRPGEIIRGYILDPGIDAGDVVVGLGVEEWIDVGDGRKTTRYPIGDGRVFEESGRVVVEVELPYDPTVPKDTFFFYPYTFSASGGGISLGATPYMTVVTSEWEREVRLAVVPREPRYGLSGGERGDKRRRGPLLPI